MTKQNLNKQNLNKTKKEYLEQVFKKNVNNFCYKEAIKIFEKYLRQYNFPDELMCKLGLLYDHLAMQLKLRNKRSKMAYEYEKKALNIYRGILKHNPKFYKAIYGIGHVYRNQGKLKTALKYHLRAYRLDTKKQSTSGIGLLYSLMGNDKKAEYWYKKELKDKGENDFGANLNLVFFYNRQNYAKAHIYAERVEKYLKKQPLSFQKSKWGKIIKEEIERIKRPSFQSWAKQIRCRNKK